MSMEETVRFTNIGAARPGGLGFGSCALAAGSGDGGCCQSQRCAPAPSATRTRLAVTHAAPWPSTTQTMVHGPPTKKGDATGRCRPGLSGRQLGRRRPYVQKAGQPAVAFDEPGLGQIIRTVDIGHQHPAIIDRQAASPEMFAALERIGPRLAGRVLDYGELVH